MGRQASGAQFNVTAVGSSGTGRYAYYLLDPTNGSCAIQSCSFTVDAPPDDKTANGDTSKSFGTLRKSHTWNLSCRFPRTTRKLGHAGLLTVGSGSATVTHCRTFSLSCDYGENEITPINTSGYPSGMEKWYYYAPKRMPVISGSWTGTRDDATAELETFFEGDTAPSITYKLTEEGATDNTIAFSTITTQRMADADIPGDGPQNYGYNFNATGAITIAGTAGIFPAAALSTGVLGPQIYSDSSGYPDQTITGFAAGSANKTIAYVYLRRWSIDVPATGPIIVTAELRGTGPLTSSDS